jgi:ribosome-binding factor A
VAVAKKPYKRRERVGPLIHRKLNAMLARRVVSLPLSVGQMSIVSVDVSPDFAQAKIYFSLLDEQDIQEVTGCLNDAAVLFQRELARDLVLRRVPKLIFVFDDTLLAAKRISDLLANNVVMAD